MLSGCDLDAKFGGPRGIPGMDGGRVEKITGAPGNPYAYISANGLKIKINHTGEKHLDNVLLEHFTKTN